MNAWNRLLFGGDNRIAERNVLWNTFGSAVYALTSMLIGTAVTRVLGADLGGIFFFAFSSIIGNYTYGEMNVKFLTARKGWLTFVRVMNGVVMVFFGSLASLDLVWSLGDLFMGSITLCNLVAIVKLSPQACFLLNDYRQQKRNGIKSPVFHRSQMPDIEKDIEAW